MTPLLDLDVMCTVCGERVVRAMCAVAERAALEAMAEQDAEDDL